MSPPAITAIEAIREDARGRGQGYYRQAIARAAVARARREYASMSDAPASIRDAVNALAAGANVRALATLERYVEGIDRCRACGVDIVGLGPAECKIIDSGGAVCRECIATSRADLGQPEVCTHCGYICNGSCLD